MSMRTLSAAILMAGLLGSGAARAEADPGLKTAAPKTAAQRDMLKVVQRWHDTYNGEVDKMILETYDPDANVVFTGASVHGQEQFLKLERAIKAAAPGRYMRIDQIYFIGDERTVVEAVILDKARPDYFSPWCAILKFHKHRIVLDHTYLEANRWPGIDAVAGIPTLGGLGAPSP